MITKEDIPKKAAHVLGYNFEQRFVSMIKDVIQSSYSADHVRMSETVMTAAEELRRFLYDYVYKLPQITEREDMARRTITGLYSHFLENYDIVIKEAQYLKDEDPDRGVCDFIASLTDRKAQDLYGNINDRG
jgi:dGTPase